MLRVNWSLGISFATFGLLPLDVGALLIRIGFGVVPIVREAPDQTQGLKLFLRFSSLGIPL